MWCSALSALVLLECLSVSFGADAEPNSPSTINTQGFGSSLVSYECLTHDNAPGRCINYSECPELASKSTKQLQVHLCFNYRRVGQPTVVCCGSQSGGAQLQEERYTTLRMPPEKNDSSNHSNARFLPEDCGRHPNGSTSAGRTLGKENTELGEFPWMVLLKYRQGIKERFSCGGTLIGDRYVLTAAHCVVLDDARLIAAHIGEHDHTTNPDCGTPEGRIDMVCAPAVQEIPVSKIIPHEEYEKSNRNHYHDIALIVLQYAAQFNDYVHPICLPFGEIGRRDLTGTRLWVAGWGTRETGWAHEIKRKLKIPVSGHDECTGMYRRARIFIGRDKQICAGGERGKNSCHVDSGGPLMNYRGTIRGDMWYLQGIASFGPTDCAAGVPGIYTKVSPYLGWILNNLAV